MASMQFGTQQKVAVMRYKRFFFAIIQQKKKKRGLAYPQSLADFRFQPFAI